MKKFLHFLIFSILLNIVFSASTFSQSGVGTITGRISDENGQAMVGATILIEEIMLGTIADANGNYQLIGVPAGSQTVKISFIGYTDVEVEIEVVRGKVTKIDRQLSVSSIELLEVVAYGQARGQLAAINQQLNAKGISNVVSGEKLRELPDVNVAEAVGRLPGLMVERNRGEGQKIIIRGLAPKYNTVSIGGHMAPSTSTDDRSTDLSMISPEILGGVEVLKANTADKDADGLGGTVNLTLREAPSGFKMSASILTGYSGHSESLSNYRGTFYMSNRFFDEKLGVMVTANVDIAERNSDKMEVDYGVQGDPLEDEDYVQPWIDGLELQANVEDRTRSGGSLLMDWKLSPSSTIKATNFFGYLDRDIYDRVKDYSLGNNRIYFKGYHQEVSKLLFSNALEGKHFVLGSVLDWGASRSQSINKRPYGTRYDFRQQSAFIGYESAGSFDMFEPELLPSPENLQEEIGQSYFYESRNVTYNANEVETSFFMNWQTPFRLGDVSGYIKVGAKHRYKKRDRTNFRTGRRIDYPQQVGDFLDVYPDYTLTTAGTLDKLQLINFLDEDYVPSDFMDGEYEYLSVNEVLNSDQMANIYENYLHDWEYIIYSVSKDDYVTDESIQAYYLMTEINIGKYITFIPGLRYVKTYLKYDAKIAEALPDGENRDQEEQALDMFKDTTANNTYYNILPQIHLRIKPTSWFDIRLAYTNTISRADYNQLAPKEIVNSTSQTVKLGNTLLKPAASENFDIILTFYKSRFGLFTVGAFQKNIENFLWTRDALIRTGTDTDPDLLNLSYSTVGYIVTYPVNNENMSTIKGLEFDIQTNLDFLPVKGIVFNANFTLMESETKYAETLIERVLNPDYGVILFAPRTIFINRDTAYVDRLLSQPNYLANIGIGYDNKKWGTSVRLSFNYQDDILTREQRRPDGADREGTLEFYRWDFQLNQRIANKLSLNVNVSNIFNQPDRSVRLITGYYTELEYYGYMAQIGLKYNF